MSMPIPSFNQAFDIIFRAGILKAPATHVTGAAYILDLNNNHQTDTQFLDLNSNLQPQKGAQLTRPSHAHPRTMYTEPVLVAPHEALSVPQGEVFTGADLKGLGVTVETRGVDLYYTNFGLDPVVHQDARPIADVRGEVFPIVSDTMQVGIIREHATPEFIIYQPKTPPG